MTLDEKLTNFTEYCVLAAKKNPKNLSCSSKRLWIKTLKLIL